MPMTLLNFGKSVMNVYCLQLNAMELCETVRICLSQLLLVRHQANRSTLIHSRSLHFPLTNAQTLYRSIDWLPSLLMKKKRRNKLLQFNSKRIYMSVRLLKLYIPAEFELCFLRWIEFSLLWLDASPEVASEIWQTFYKLC
jgi:hypothetical protein